MLTEREAVQTEERGTLSEVPDRHCFLKYSWKLTGGGGGGGGGGGNVTDETVD